MVIPWSLISSFRFWSISWTSLWNCSLWMRSSVICWYWWISWSATVLSQKWHGFFVLLALGAHLPLCKGGVHSWETLPGLDNLFLFVLHAWTTNLRAVGIFILTLLACCTCARKVPGGLLMKPLLGLMHPFLWPEFLWAPLLYAGNVGFPLTGWILSIHQSLWYPLGKKIFQCHLQRCPQCTMPSGNS